MFQHIVKGLGWSWRLLFTVHFLYSVSRGLCVIWRDGMNSKDDLEASSESLSSQLISFRHLSVLPVNRILTFSSSHLSVLLSLCGSPEHGSGFPSLGRGSRAGAEHEKVRLGFLSLHLSLSFPIQVKLKLGNIRHAWEKIWEHCVREIKCLNKQWTN